MPRKKLIAKHRKDWATLILNMADGDVIKANEINGMDARREFWQFLDYFNAKQQEKINNMRQNKKRQ